MGDGCVRVLLRSSVCDDGSCDVAWLDANVECGVDFGFGDNDASARDQRHKERR